MRWMALFIFVLTAACDGPGGDLADAAPADGAPAADAAPSDGDLADGAPADAEGDLPADAGDDPLAAWDAECPTPEVLVAALKRRYRDLRARGRELDEREHDLKQLGRAIDDRLAALEKTRALAAREADRLADERAGECRAQEAAYQQQVAELRREYEDLERGLERWDEAQRDRADEAREAEIVKLSNTLSSMRPEKAAATLGSLDHETAALLLGRLPERSSGKILAVMAPATAAAIVKTMLEPPEAAGRDELLEVARSEDRGGPDAGAGGASGEEGRP